MPKSLGIALPWAETFNVGIDTGTPVDDADYQMPFPFTGKISKLTVKVGPQELAPKEKMTINKSFRDRQ